MTPNESKRRANTRRLMWTYHGIERDPDGTGVSECLSVRHDEERGVVVATCLDGVELIAVPARKVIDPTCGDHPWEVSDGGLRLLPTRDGIAFARAVVAFVELFEAEVDLIRDAAASDYAARYETARRMRSEVDLAAMRVKAHVEASRRLAFWVESDPPE